MFVVERIPRADELLDFDRHIEIIRQAPAAAPLPSGRACASSPLRIAANRRRQPAGSADPGAQSDQIQQVMREPVAFAALIRYRETVFLPRLIKQRDHAVVEDIEEIAQRRDLWRGCARESSRCSTGADSQGTVSPMKFTTMDRRAGRIAHRAPESGWRETP